MVTCPNAKKLHPHMGQRQVDVSPDVVFLEQQRKMRAAYEVEAARLDLITKEKVVDAVDFWKLQKQAAKAALNKLGWAWTPEHALHELGISQSPQRLTIPQAGMFV